MHASKKELSILILFKFLFNVLGGELHTMGKTKEPESKS